MMSQSIAKRQKTMAYSELTIICVARSSAPQGDHTLHKQRLEKCNDTLHKIVIATLPEWKASAYVHFELIVSSNADFSIQGGTLFRQLRHSIVTASSSGPMQLVMSSEDGLTTNAPGLVKWLKTLPDDCLANVNFFVSRLADEPMQFTATRYLKAFELLQQHDEVSVNEAHLYETELAFVGTQLDTSQNKIAMSDAMKRSRETMLSDGIKRNDKIQPKTTSSVPLANLATSQTRTLVGVNIERNESGKLICPNTSCDEAFDNEKDLTWHLRKDIKANGNVCILCPPVVNRKPLTDRMLTEHIKSHLSSKMIECQICGKPILESKQDQHDLKHHTTQEDAEHWCTPCAKSFITAGALERHNAERHEDAEKMECPKCGRTMTNASYETHRKLACKADPTIPMRERVSCPACHRTILKKNIHQHYRKHERNDAILDFLDALPVLEDGDEGMESGDEMDGDNAGDDEDEE